MFGRRRCEEVARRQSSPITGKPSARPAGKPGFWLVKENLRRSLPRHFDPTASKNNTVACGMRFLRDGGIFRSDVVKVKTKYQTLGLGRAASRWSALRPGTRTCREDHALIIVFDEFRPANPRSGWSPPEPVSASPAHAD